MKTGDPGRYIAWARKVLRSERAGLEELESHLNHTFVDAVQILAACRGRVILTGVGKSGIVAKKIAATLTSTGTPAIFLHPTESLHGDLGIVHPEDVVIAISKSGESDEFQILIPLLKRFGVPIIAITARPDSDLAENADVVLTIPGDQEAMLGNLVPTVSTTVTMALGDALAFVLMRLKGFTVHDFAALHPGGAIGKKIWLRVRDLMLTGPDHVPVVSQQAPMMKVILEMTSKRGITSVVDDEGRLVGVFTDGDLRRLLEREHDIFRFCAKDVMTRHPKTASPDDLAAQAAQQMVMYGITALLVVDVENRPMGILHLHDLMRERVI